MVDLPQWRVWVESLDRSVMIDEVQPGTMDQLLPQPQQRQLVLFGTSDSAAGSAAGAASAAGAVIPGDPWRLPATGDATAGGAAEPDQAWRRPDLPPPPLPAAGDNAMLESMSRCLEDAMNEAAPSHSMH